MGERFDDFISGEIEITTSLGVTSIRVLRQGAWAVHREYGPKRSSKWRVTHVRTGLAFPNVFESQAVAVAIVRRLLKLRNDWDFDSQDCLAFEDAKKFFHEVARPLCPKLARGTNADRGKKYRVNERISL